MYIFSTDVFESATHKRLSVTTRTTKGYRMTFSSHGGGVMGYRMIFSSHGGGVMGYRMTFLQSWWWSDGVPYDVF